MDYEKVYVGETSPTKDTRMTEHKAKIKVLASDSKIVEHIPEHKHKFDFSNAKILAFEGDWKKRIIKEGILTNRTLGKSINETKHTIQVVS